MGVAAATRARVRGDIERLVHRGVGLGELVGTVSRTLHKAVPFDGTCLLTLDPATLLPTGELTDNALPPPASRRLGELELTEPDFNKFTELAHAEMPAASLSVATAGDLTRSLRQREVRGPNGFADELRAVLTDRTGRFLRPQTSWSADWPNASHLADLERVVRGTRRTRRDGRP